MDKESVIITRGLLEYHKRGIPTLIGYIGRYNRVYYYKFNYSLTIF